MLQKGKGSILHTQSLNTRHDLGDFDVHFTPVFNNNREVEGVLIMFGPGSEVSSSRPQPLKVVEKKKVAWRKKVAAKTAGKSKKTSLRRKK